MPLPCKVPLALISLSSDPLAVPQMSFHRPRKLILTKEQLQVFQESKTHQDIVAFIEDLNESVVGVKLTDPCNTSPVRL